MRKINHVESGGVLRRNREQDVGRVKSAVRDSALVHAARERKERCEVGRTGRVLAQVLLERDDRRDFTGDKDLVAPVAPVAAMRPGDRLRAGDGAFVQAREQLEFALDAVGHEPVPQGIEEVAAPVHLEEGAPALRQRLGPDQGPGFRLDERLVRRTRRRSHQLRPSFTISAKRWPEAMRDSGGAATRRPPPFFASSATRSVVMVILGGLRLKGWRMRRVRFLSE